MGKRAQNRWIAGILAGLLVPFGALGSSAASDAVEPADAPAPTEAAAPIAVRAPTALAAAFAAILQDEAARLHELEARFLAAADATAALAIEREIATLKSGTELRLMGAQARVARDEGRLEDATRIEVAIAQMVEAAARPPLPPAPMTPRRDDSPSEGGAR